MSDLSAEHHDNAAFHHESAAMHHRQASEHRANGNHSDADRHTSAAYEHGKNAYAHGAKAEKHGQRAADMQPNQPTGSASRGTRNNNTDGERPDSDANGYTAMTNDSSKDDSNGRSARNRS